MPRLPQWLGLTCLAGLHHRKLVMNLAPTKALDMHPHLRQIKALDDYFAWRRAAVKSGR